MKVVQYVDSNLFAPKDAWSKLTAQEKADVLRAGVENGYTKLSDIKKKYNEFAEGGDKLSRKPTPGSVDQEFMATRPTPFDILARTALNYSNQEFGHSFSSENSPSEPEPLNFDELKQRQRFMETGFNDNLISPVGAKGRYQITDNTLAEYTKKTGKTGDLFDPTFNEAVRDWYMDESLENRSWITKREPTDSVKYGKKLAAYNYGPTNVVRALEKAKAAGKDIYTTFDWLGFMPRETQDYVNFILRNKDVGKHKNQAEYDKAVSKLNKKELGGPIIQAANIFKKAGKMQRVDATFDPATGSYVLSDVDITAKEMPKNKYIGYDDVVFSPGAMVDTLSLAGTLYPEVAERMAKQDDAFKTTSDYFITPRRFVKPTKLTSLLSSEYTGRAPGSPAYLTDITDDVTKGSAMLYPHGYINDTGYYFFRDKNNGRYYTLSKSEAPEVINPDNFERISYDDLRKVLPAREYIGGPNYRRVVASRIPGFTDAVYKKAKDWGLDPNLMMHRIFKEGFIDSVASGYNDLATSERQKTYFDEDYSNRDIDGFHDFGLDDAGDMLDNKIYTLNDPSVTWESLGAINESGREVHSVIGHGLNSILEILAADLNYRRNKVKELYNVDDADADRYTNAAFNRGLYSDKLNDHDFIVNEYSYPQYYNDDGTFNVKANGGAIVQAANVFRRGGSKMAKKVSDFSNGLLSPEDVDIILEHPSDFSEYLGWNQEKIDSLKNNFYKNTAPYGYDVLNGIAALQNTGINPQPIGTSAKEDMARDYLFAEYLGIPKENRKYPSTGIFTQSEYSPSMGSNTDTKYVRFSDEEDRNKIVSIYNDLVSRIVTVPGTGRKVRSGKPYFSGVGNNLYRITPGKSGKNYAVSELDAYNFNEDPYAASLGQYTVGKGFDNKGQYISVYDEWDLNPMHVAGSTAFPLPKKLVNKFSSLGDASGKFGKPVKYYDRIYLDDYYDIPEQYRGNYYLPEVTIKP